jgi:hypothetical protein
MEIISSLKIHEVTAALALEHKWNIQGFHIFLEIHLPSRVTEVLWKTRAMADNEANGCSSDDGVTSDADFENYIISGDQSTREYYIGKKYFELALATRLLKHSNTGETWSELDVS